jgi:membrane-associated protein
MKKELIALGRDVHGLAALFLMPLLFIVVMSLALKDVYAPPLRTLQGKVLMAGFTALVAAILGDQCNYLIGRRVGVRVFSWNNRWFNRRAFDQAHAFYQRYGAITLVLARFMPFVRTFAPFVAGVADMERTRFTLFNVVGALIWVLGLCGAGFLFGNLEVVRKNLQIIIWALILVPGLVAIVGAYKASRTAP